jgi:hypothetical protein
MLRRRRIEAGVRQNGADGGDDIRAEGGCRARQADKRKTGRLIMVNSVG